ncbi:MAG: hypothetical protein R3E32_25245 [Chitinophagales bacterium]
MLHDRLHAVLYHIENIKGNFTISTNFVDKDLARLPKYRNKNITPIVYGGIEIQRRILRKKKTIKRNLKEYWQFLDDTVIDYESSHTYQMLNKFRKGELSLKDIKMGNLRGYFVEPLENDTRTKIRTTEKAIFESFLDLEKDAFISIPIIAFGNFEGVVHIIGQLSVIEKLSIQDTIERIIKIFSLEFESLLLDWDVAFENIEQYTQIKLDQLDYDVEYVSQNPIMKECKFRKFYEISDYFHKKRIAISNEATKKILTQQKQILSQHRQNAIISILIDSFAHNISTHSLTALAWWFAERAIYSNAKKNNLKRLLDKYKNDINQNPLVLHKKRVNEPLSTELSAFLRFLAEKAIFWNAITRKTNFTGQFFNLYNVLFKEFINNPLYLGSIANSEKIQKIHFHFTIYTEEYELTPVTNRKTIKKVGNVLLDGRLATINFKDFYLEENQAKRKVRDSQQKEATKNLEFVDSIFIERGDNFDLFREELINTIAFFPSGVVGKHALFTVLENEIRNIKHYKGLALTDAQDNGLIVNLSIHTRPVNSDKDVATPFKKYELYKLGIWLKHPSIDLDGRLIGQRFESLAKDIITEETYRPRLGGMYQDKICAAMLFNNSFDSVQPEKMTDRDARYYPWVKAAVSPVANRAEDVYEFEISQRKYEITTKENTYDDEYHEFLKKYGGESKEVYYKKYIHLWKAENIHYFRGEAGISWENKARFKFLHIEKDNRDAYVKLRQEGFIRILQQPIPNNDIQEAYKKWLHKWSKTQEPVSIELAISVDSEDEEEIKDKQDVLYRFVYHNGSLYFENADAILEDDSITENLYDSISDKRSLTVAHGGGIANTNMCNFRSTGILLRNFFDVEDIGGLADSELKPLLAYELYETFITKAVIIDERVFRRIPPDRVDYFSDALQLEFYDENFEQWEEVMEPQDLTQYHFLVVHLSFIERMKQKKNPNEHYGEGGIVDFIEERVLKGKKPSEVPDNFVLVIITGRGRIEWWDKLKKNQYDRFVTFRPIESLLAAVEDAILLNDDFNLKYYTTKVLFGS